MPGKKNSLCFDDLGLDVALPSVLSKSKAERKMDMLDKRKAKKEREREAMEIVASSREVVQKRKREIEAESLAQQSEREQRKKMNRLEHIKSRSEREKREADLKKEAIASHHELVEKIKKGWDDQEQQQKEVQMLLEEEREREAKSQPNNVHITIHRTEKIAEQRADLPVVREEQPIMEAINSSSRSCVLVSGETGSGKTTQIPQFLWEAGYGHTEGVVFGRDGCVLVTEPRRVAAVSMARRVAEELNVEFGREVCYHVRYDNNLSDDCRIKFATEGVVLKEIQSDFLLKKYSAIIVDEAHERSISCDVLIGLLSRIMPLRNDLFQEELRACNDMSKVKVKPLKLVIMSATLHIADFRDNRKLFPIPPPLIQVDARRFPVSNHFARKTELREYVNEAFKKVRQIHKKLPPGGILVFLTTQHEIEELCERLREHYQKNKIEYSSNSYNAHATLLGREREEMVESDDDEPHSPKEEEQDEYGLQTEDYALGDGEGGNVPEEEPLDRFSAEAEGKPSAEDDSPNANEGGEKADDEVNGEYNTLHVLPLYALLNFQQQQEVFKDPPKGKRLCVIATNVAETSLTIPNIKYVVDSGRAKMKVMEQDTKASSYRIDWVSQASSEQRSGRAGRMGPGHCYRLYSTAVYANLMPKHTTPEILRTPLDTVVLLMKQVGIPNVKSFPFPSPPAEQEIFDAAQHLCVVGALDVSHRITPLGRKLVMFPVPPRFARALTEAVKKKCSPRVMEMVCAIVATVSTVTSVFTAEGNRKKGMSNESCKEDTQAQAIKALLNPGSDLLTYLNAFAAYYSQPQKCWYLCMVQKSMQEVKMLFHQIRSMVHRQKVSESVSRNDTDEVADTMDESETVKTSGELTCFAAKATFLVERSEELQLRRLFIPGLLDQVARRATVHECRVMGVEYMDKKTSKAAYLIVSSKSIAFVHPTSSVAKTFPPPEYLTFSFLQKVHRSEHKVAKTLMLGVTIVTKEWLSDCGFTE